jgi:hypothetical protein
MPPTLFIWPENQIVGDRGRNEGTIAMFPDTVAIVSASLGTDTTESDRNSGKWQIFETRGD